MSIPRITCTSNSCNRLARNATPTPGANFDTRAFCSLRCSDRSSIDALICRGNGCNRMTAHVARIPQPSPYTFDVHTYCTVGCAHDHYRRSPLSASLPICMCTVCATYKPLSSFVHIVYPVTRNHWEQEKTNVSIPPACRHHIMPEHDLFRTGICIACISTFLTTRFSTHGVRGIVCIDGRCAPYFADLDPEVLDWVLHASSFLPAAEHAEMQEQALELWLSRRSRWSCPGCGFAGAILDPVHTPGYPHVHCSGCALRFCAQCRVPWHEGRTCLQYRAEHPEIKDEGDVEALEDMARAEARRCPSCQAVVIKERGL